VKHDIIQNYWTKHKYVCSFFDRKQQWSAIIIVVTTELVDFILLTLYSHVLSLYSRKRMRLCHNEFLTWEPLK
jgi:hypothetical protein